MGPDVDYLLKYMKTRFDEMAQRFDRVDERINELHGAVDAYAKRPDAYFQDRRWSWSRTRSSATSDGSTRLPRS